jgi:hypothetical protein
MFSDEVGLPDVADGAGAAASFIAPAAATAPAPHMYSSALQSYGSAPSAQQPQLLQQRSSSPRHTAPHVDPHARSLVVPVLSQSSAPPRSAPAAPSAATSASDGQQPIALAMLDAAIQQFRAASAAVELSVQAVKESGTDVGASVTVQALSNLLTSVSGTSTARVGALG